MPVPTACLLAACPAPAPGRLQQLVEKRRRLRRMRRRQVRLGETIYKGHRSYDLMLNLQLGIRYTITTLNKLPPPLRMTGEHYLEKVGGAGWRGGWVGAAGVGMGGGWVGGWVVGLFGRLHWLATCCAGISPHLLAAGHQPWASPPALPPGAGVAALPARGQRGDAAPPLQRLQVEGLLPHSLQVRQPAGWLAGWQAGWLAAGWRCQLLGPPHQARH